MTAFLDRVRAELSGVTVVDATERRCELAGLVRLGGSTDTTAGGSLEVSSGSGAVARRAYRLLVDETGIRPQLAVRRADGATLHRVRLDAPPVALIRLGDPARPWPAAINDRSHHAAAALRGAFLARGSCSEPGRPVHLELPVPSDVDARVLADAAALASGYRPSVSVLESGVRLVWKSGEAVGALLATLGASSAFLAWDERRLRRELRADATRLANADAANVRRSVRAAAAQLEAVERVVDELGWDALDADLREIALVRLANPDASLAEVGELCDPPISKSAAHRRLARLTGLVGP